MSSTSTSPDRGALGNADHARIRSMKRMSRLRGATSSPGPCRRRTAGDAHRPVAAIHPRVAGAGMWRRSPTGRAAGDRVGHPCRPGRRNHRDARVVATRSPATPGLAQPPAKTGTVQRAGQALGHPVLVGACVDEHDGGPGCRPASCPSGRHLTICRTTSRHARSASRAVRPGAHERADRTERHLAVPSRVNT